MMALDFFSSSSSVKAGLETAGGGSGGLLTLYCVKNKTKNNGIIPHHCMSQGWNTLRMWLLNGGARTPRGTLKDCSRNLENKCT